MQFISFYIFYGFMWLFTRLPLKVIYGISDLLYLFVFYLVPYRKKLVKRNMRNSFPDWTEKQLRDHMKKFYRHFCDSFFESSITAFISEKEIKKRFVIKNPEICNDLYDKEKSITLLMTHYGNWEWSSSMQLYLQHKTLPIYKPLHNKYFDNFIKKSRERFGAKTVPMDKTLRILMDYKKKNIPTITFFLADQRPRWAQIQHWIKFMNQDTPVILGPEKISKKLGNAVLFLKIEKKKRGFYESEFILVNEDPVKTEPYEITEKYYKLLEKLFKEKPDYWLWTHARWKHEKEKFKQKATPLG